MFNLVKNIKFMNICCLIFALTGLRYVGTKFRMDKRFLYYSILACVGSVSEMCYHVVYLLHELTLTPASFTITLSVAIDIITSITFVCALNNVSTFHQLMNAMRLPIINLDYRENKKAYRFRIFMLLLAIGISFTRIFFLLQMRISRYNSDVIFNYAIVIFQMTKYIRIILQRLVIYFSMMIIKAKYDILFDRLNQICRGLEYADDRNLQFYFLEIRRTLTIQEQLRTLAVNITKNFEFAIFLLLLNNCINFILEPSLLVRLLRHDATSVPFELFPITFTAMLGLSNEFLWFYLAIQPYQNILDLDKQFCHKLWDSLCDQLGKGYLLESFEELEHILQSRMANPLVFNIFGVLNVDRSLIGALLSAFTTYSIILIQYRNKIM